MSTTSDEERCRRYLDWKRATERERADRRRRAVAYVAAPAVCVLAIGLAAWLERPSRDRSHGVSAVTVGSQSETTAKLLEPEATAPPVPNSPPPASDEMVAPPRQAEEPASPVRAQPRRPPTVAARPRVRPVPPRRPVSEPSLAATPAPPAPTHEAAGQSDVAAAVAPAPLSAPAPASRAAPAGVPAEARRETVVNEPRQAPAEAAAPTRTEPVPVPAPERAPTPRDVVTPPTPPPETPMQTPAVRDQTSAATPPSGGAVAPPTVRERVTTWAKGEADEFRDGVRREIREFRSSYEKVRDFFRR
jgi:hypothetical protein